MAMKRCPVCGEKYSETYRDCPFCEEEEAMREGEEIRRKPRRGKRMARGRRFSLITPTLIILILIMSGVLIHLLYGDDPSDRIDQDGTPDTPPVEDVQKPEEPDDAQEPDDTQTPMDAPVPDDTQEPDDGGVTMPEDSGTGTDTPDTPDESDGPAPVEDTNESYEAAMELPGGLSLSKTDFSLFYVGESATIRASGGSGSYEWISQDDGVASVDENGKVTAISSGTINVIATDGEKKGVCIVRVKVSGGSSQPATTPSAPAATPSTGSSGGSGDSGSGGAHELNREDMTLVVGEKFRLKLTGVTTALTWSSANPGVAEVAGDGTVTAAHTGTTTVTVSWDGGSASCIVRVK